MVLGVDVSHWQDDKSTPQKVNFIKAMTMGARFVFIKVSERGGMDEDFLINWKNAKAAGIPRGGYHFLRWDISGLLQARIFCDLLKDDPGELPPVCDFEAPIKDGKYPSNAMLAQFLEAVESILGKKPMIYTSPGFWNSYGKNKNTGKFDASWSYYPLWIAHYTSASSPQVPEPWKSLALSTAEGAHKPWLFWQHSANGDGLKYGAESKSIDLNWFNGSQSDLDHLTGKIETPTGEGDPAVEPPAGGGSEFAYLQKQIDILGKSIKNIENFLSGFRSSPQVAGSVDTRTEASS